MKDIQYEINGPGLIRATQESIKAGKQLVIAYDRDENLNILRVGYYLEDKIPQKSVEPNITWFKKEEIEIIVNPNITSQPPGGRLEVEFLHGRTEQRHLMIDFPVGQDKSILIRCLFRIGTKTVADFIVQAEVKGIIGEKVVWQPVVRYDCAHGFIHRDLIDINGNKTKEELSTQNPKQAINLAVIEIRRNLGVWLKQLGYEQISVDLLEQSLVDDLEITKSKLIEFLDNPKLLEEDPQSRIIILGEHSEYDFGIDK